MSDYLSTRTYLFYILNGFLYLCSMSRKKVYIENLTDAEIAHLEAGWKEGKSHDFRNRCQCILLSHQGYDAAQLSSIYAVTIYTIYDWIKKWKKDGIEGIKTKSG